MLICEAGQGSLVLTGGGITAMASWDIEIRQERVGPFYIGQKFRAPCPIVSKDGRSLSAGDAFYLEPSRDISIVMDLAETADGLTCSVLEMIIDDTSEATLNGKPLREASLSFLLRGLAEYGVKVFSDADSVMHLTHHAMLGVFGDRIDKVVFGADQRQFERKWNEVEDPLTIANVVNAASNAPKTVG